VIAGRYDDKWNGRHNLSDQAIPQGRGMSEIGK
jgi:hypothetical protein